jgi:hypothetical protein
MLTGGWLAVGLGGATMISGMIVGGGGLLISAFSLGLFGDGLSAGGLTLMTLGVAGLGSGIPLVVVGNRRQRAHHQWQFRNRSRLQPTVQLGPRGPVGFGLQGRFLSFPASAASRTRNLGSSSMRPPGSELLLRFADDGA